MNINPDSSVNAQHASGMTKSLADYSDDEARAAIFKAIERGDMETFNKLYDHHPAINADVLNEEGQNFLHVAVQANNSPVALQLTQICDHFTDYLNAVDNDGFTPLMYAVRGGQVDLVEALLKAGASADISLTEQRSALVDKTGSNSHGWDARIVPSALQLAVAFGVDALDLANDGQKSKEIVALLMNAGADPSDALMRSLSMEWMNTSRALIDDLKADPLRAFYLASMAHQDDAARALRFLGADGIADMVTAGQSGDQRSIDALHRTVRLEDTATAANVLASTGNVDAVRSLFSEKAHYTIALRQAIQNGNSANVKVLIEAAATSQYGSLRSAAKADAARLPVVQARVDNQLPNVNGFEQFAQHLSSGDKEALAVLRQAGIEGYDALMYFAQNGDRDEAKIILNAARGEKDARRALAIAVENNDPELAKALISVGVDAEKELAQFAQKDGTKYAKGLINLGVSVPAALMHAVESGSPRAVTIFRLLGADFSSALLCAAERGNTSAAKALLDTGAVNVAEVVERAVANGDEDSVNFLLDLSDPINNLEARA